MINHSESLQGIKIDIQTMGVDLNRYLQRKIRLMIKKLQNLLPQAGSIDVYLKQDTNGPTNLRNVTVRFGIPGPDVVWKKESGWTPIAAAEKRQQLKRTSYEPITLPRPLLGKLMIRSSAV